MGKKKLAALLVAHLERCGIKWPGGAENLRVFRIHSGHNQRAAGAASWRLATHDGTFCPEVIGFDRASKVAAAKVAYVSVELGSFVLNAGEPTPRFWRKPYGVSRVPGTESKR